MSLQEFSDLPLENIGPGEKAPPRRRVKNAKSAREIYENLKKGDERSNAARMRVQAMLDGVPPYDDAMLRSRNQSFKTNINFGEGATYLEEALTAYVDLVHSTESLVRVETSYGEPEQKKEWSRIMSEQYSFQLRQWSRFNFEFLHLCHHFVGHGVGINFFEEPDGWPWCSSGLGDFLVPRQTKANAAEVEVAAAERKMTIPELFAKIEDPKAAERMGWNREAVINAIKGAYGNSNSATFDAGMDWEKFQAEVKNNDLYMGAKTAKIEVVHLWVKEFSGKVSHMIVLRQGGTEKERFLLEQPDKYKSINEAFHFFTYGIGTNGTFHSIRGLAFKIFSLIQLGNRMRGQAIDNAMLAGAPMVQSTDEGGTDDLAFNFYGPFAVLPPNIQMVKDRSIPNVATTMMPVMSDMDRLTQRRTGQYSSQSAMGDKSSRKTRFQVATELEEHSKLSATSQNLFYGSWDMFHIELARRFHMPNYSSNWEGYDAVKDYRDRCIAKGVPEEALDAVDYKRTKAVRAIGNGSQGTRIVQLQQMNEIAGTFDEDGRHNLHRDQAAAIVGQDAADRYIPARPDSRTTQDHRIAQLETNDLLSGRDMDPYPDDLHLVHLEIHTPAIEQIFQQVQEGQLDLVQGYQMTEKLFHHCVEHVGYMQTDFTIQDRVKEFNQRLQQLSELIINGQRAFAKQQQEAEEQAAQGGGQEGQQPQMDPKDQAKLIEAQAKLRMMEESHQQDMYHRLQKHQQNLAIEEAKAAAKVKDMLR